MGTTTRVALAAIAACALTISTAVPAGAQEEPETLGFAVDKTQAQPGALVLGKANADDVAEHCVTEVEPFQARFQEVLEGPFAFGNFEGPLFDIIWPDFDPEVGPVYDNYDKVGYVVLLFVVAGLAGLTGPEPAEDALPQTFVMTFADIATQEPVGARGNFDPNTGDGSVVVPDIEPGNWAVAAACVGPSLDIATLEAGIRAAGDFLESIGAPVTDPLSPEMIEFMQEFLGSEATGLSVFIEFLTAIGPTVLEPIMVPDAFGAVIFCILDDQGVCPGDEPPPPELKPEDTKDMTPPAQPVVATPSFTG